MVTKTTTQPAAAPPAPAVQDEPAPTAVPEPRVTIWQHHGLPLPQLGLRTVPKSQADAIIGAGLAVPADGRSNYPFRRGTEPLGFPPGPPPPPPQPPNPPVVAITAISAENPAKATVSTADIVKIMASGAATCTVSGATGTDAASVNKQFPIGAVTGTTFVLTGLDNSLPLSFTGYPLVGTTAAAAPPAPAEPPAPAPAPEPAPPPEVRMPAQSSTPAEDDSLL